VPGLKKDYLFDVRWTKGNLAAAATTGLGPCNSLLIAKLLPLSFTSEKHNQQYKTCKKKNDTTRE